MRSWQALIERPNGAGIHIMIIALLLVYEEFCSPVSQAFDIVWYQRLPESKAQSIISQSNTWILVAIQSCVIVKINILT